MRYCRLLKLSGQKGGYLFPDELSSYEDMFFSILEDVQSKRRDLISPIMDVREDFGIHRSLRRGVTSDALNMEIGEDLLKAINRWRSERNSMGCLDMVGNHSRLDSIKPTVLRFSGNL